MESKTHGQSKTDPVKTDPKYAERFAFESAHFGGQTAFAELPAMVHFWSQRYLRPRLMQIFGTSHTNFYVKPIMELAKSKATVDVVSLGSGDGAVETGMASALFKNGVKNVRLVGIEQSAKLVGKANAHAKSLGLDGILSFRCGDLNALDTDHADIYIANQILHHVVGLEQLFETINDAMPEHGLLLTRDMIGMNGHQAWPEAKAVVDELWETLPENYKYHHRLKKHFAAFPNIDFSTSGFEGIRSQDIMPLLTKYFGFSHFYAYGGIVERFINRGFGPNYSAENPHDIAFMTSIQLLNDALLDGGLIAPTQIVAYCTKRQIGAPKIWKNRTPLAAVRKAS